MLTFHPAGSSSNRRYSDDLVAAVVPQYAIRLSNRFRSEKDDRAVADMGEQCCDGGETASWPAVEIGEGCRQMQIVDSPQRTGRGLVQARLAARIQDRDVHSPRQQWRFGQQG